MDLNKKKECKKLVINAVHGSKSGSFYTIYEWKHTHCAVEELIRGIVTGLEFYSKTKIKSFKIPDLSGDFSYQVLFGMLKPFARRHAVWRFHAADSILP